MIITQHAVENLKTLCENDGDGDLMTEKQET